MTKPIPLLLPLLVLVLLAAMENAAGSLARVLLPLYATGVMVMLVAKLGDYLWQDRFWWTALLRGQYVDRRQARVRALFEGYAKRFDAELRDELDYRGPEQAAECLREYLPTHAVLDIADVGCGTGLAASSLKPWTKTLVGCDLSNKMLTKAQNRGLYDRLEQNDMITFMQRHEQSFDLILALDCLIYVTEPWKFFLAAKASCRTDGWLLVTTEIANKDPIETRRGRRRESPDVTLSLAAAAGFDLIAKDIIELRLEGGLPVQAGIFLWRAGKKT